MADKNQFNKEETERRMRAALQGARIAGHKELKDIPKKNGESRRLARKKQKSKS